MIQDCIDRRNKARQALRSTHDEIKALASRLEKLQKQLPGLIAEKQRAKSGDQSDLEKAREAEKEVSGAIETVRKQKKRAEKDMPDLNNALAAAEIELWGQVFNDMKADIQKTLGDKIIRAYAAKLMSGGVGYNSLVQEIAGGNPSPATIQQTQQELMKEYLE